MKYQIVCRDDIQDLESDVNELIAKGWFPVGGVAISEVELNRWDEHAVTTHYAQAMQTEEPISVG